MKYNARIDVKETDSGSVFVARYPALEGVSGTGATQVEALQDLEENAEAHIEFMKMDGEEPPASDFDIPVEKAKAFQVRLPFEVYSNLQDRSATTGLSMNQIIVFAVQRELINFDYTELIERTLQQFRTPCNVVSSFFEKDELTWDRGTQTGLKKGPLINPVSVLALQQKYSGNQYDNN